MIVCFVSHAEVVNFGHEGAVGAAFDARGHRGRHGLQKDVICSISDAG
jgi:hypothetical protein